MGFKNILRPFFIGFKNSGWNLGLKSCLLQHPCHSFQLTFLVEKVEFLKICQPCKKMRIAAAVNLGVDTKKDYELCKAIKRGLDELVRQEYLEYKILPNGVVEIWAVS